MAAVTSIAALLEGLQDQGSTAQAWLDPTLGLVVGDYPTPKRRYDFVHEAFTALPDGAAAAEHAGPATDHAEPPAGGAANGPTLYGKPVVDLSHKARRSSRAYLLELEEAVYRFGSATQMLIDGLPLIEERWPGVLAELARAKKRTKRPVALRREDLYDRPHPPEHSAPLPNGYFVATNNKASEALAIMRRALLLTGAAVNPERQVRPG